MKKKSSDGQLFMLGRPSPFLWTVSDTLNSFTVKWRRLAFAEMDNLHQRAVRLLMEASFIEIRFCAEARWVGYPYLLRAIFHVSGENTEAEIQRQLTELAGGLPQWLQEQVESFQARLDAWPTEARLGAPGIALGPNSAGLGQNLAALNTLIEGKLPRSPANVQMMDFWPWSPSELQREIWDALRGRALTADGLQGDLTVARGTLFKKEGGVAEMLTLDLIRNDRNMGGYYRPDAPPKI